MAGAQGATGSDTGHASQFPYATGSATISSNADNRVITGGSGTNLVGEANLTFDGGVRIQRDYNDATELVQQEHSGITLGLHMIFMLVMIHIIIDAFDNYHRVT